MNDMTIRNKLGMLISEKEHNENRKLTYRTISEETGISTGVLVRYMAQNLGAIDINTLETLCEYFNVQPGEIFYWEPKIKPASELDKISKLGAILALANDPHIDGKTKQELIEAEFRKEGHLELDFLTIDELKLYTQALQLLESRARQNKAGNKTKTNQDQDPNPSNN